MLGKHRDFCEKLIAVLSSDCKELAKTARCTEILYFLTRNSEYWTLLNLLIYNGAYCYVAAEKNKARLLDGGVLNVLLNLFKKHFEYRLQEGRLELCLISIACLRQLAKTSKSSGAHYGPLVPTIDICRKWQRCTGACWCPAVVRRFHWANDWRSDTIGKDIVQCGSTKDVAGFGTTAAFAVRILHALSAH